MRKAIRKKTVTTSILISLLLIIFFHSTTASACSRAANFSFDEIFVADVIVRATAVKYVISPNGDLRTTAEAESKIEFKVDEVLKGEKVPELIVLNGYLSHEDDFNDVPVPYTFVRPNGRAGSCFANTYKQGAQFLLFVKREQNGYTTNISALGPTNEQLHDETDRWLLWTREYLKRKGRKARPARRLFSLMSDYFGYNLQPWKVTAGFSVSPGFSLGLIDAR